MTGMIIGPAAAIVSTAAFIRFKDTEEDDSKLNGRTLDIVAFIVYALLDVFTVVLMDRAGAGIFCIVNSVILLNFLFLLAVIDIRHRSIPNRYILFMLVPRTAMIAVQGVITHSFVAVLMKSLLGLLTGVFLLGVIALVSKKGLGSGDVKMYGLTGYFLGAVAILDILIYSTLLCAVCGIALIVLKKCTAKDFLPMAPFAFAGTMVYIWLSF